MRFTKKRIFWAAAFLLSLFPVRMDADTDGIRRYAAKDIKLDYQSDETASFSSVVSIRHDQEVIYIVDAETHSIWVHSKTGVFRSRLGQKGRGPGEFDSPSDLDVFENKIYVADHFNDRVQVLDKKGHYLGGFKVRFSPDQICALSSGNIVVSHLPLGISGSEPMVHCFSDKGELLWEQVTSFDSGNKIYDTFRNLMIMIKGDRDDLYVIRKNDERTVLRYDKEGKSLPVIQVSDGLPFKKVSLPLKNGPRDLQSFCWDAAFSLGRLALLATSYTEDNDLGPGREILIIEPDGNIMGIVDLPSALPIIDMDGDRIYAVDAEGRLRILSFQPS